MKRITWWPQAWLGLTFNWGVLLGFAAAQGGPSSINLLTLVVGAWLSGFNLAVVTPGLPPAALLLYGAGVPGRSATTPSTPCRTWRTTPWPA